MKIKLVFLLFITSVSFVFGQVSKKEKDIDSLHFANQHQESIRLRKAFISSLNDKVAIDRNQLKLKLSEYHGTSSWKEGLALLESIKQNVITSVLLPDSYKVEFYGNYYHAIAYADQDWEKSLRVAKEFLAKLEKNKLKTTLSKQTELVYDIAYIFGEINQPYEAINYYQKAETLYKKQGLDQSSDMALLYNNLGYEFSKLSNFKKCNDYYILATAIWEKKALQNANYLATAYNNLIYNFIPYGEIKKAEFYLQKLKNIAKAIPQNEVDNYDKVQLSILLNELKINVFNNVNCLPTHEKFTSFFKTVSNKEKFINYYSTANNVLLNFLIQNNRNLEAAKLASATETYLKQYAYNEGLLVLYSHLVVLKKNEKEYEKALSYIEEALKIADNTSKGNQAGLYLNKGIILKELGNINQAEQLYNKAQKILDDEESADIETLSHYTEIANYRLQNYEDNKTVQNLNKAYSCYQNCVKQFNAIYKNGLFNSKLIDYLDYIHEGLFTIALYDISKQESVLDYIENTTSKYLWSNFIRNNTTKTVLNLDNNYKSLQNLNQEIVHYKAIIQTEKEKKQPNFSKINEHQNKVLELNSQAEQLQLQLLNSNSNYAKLFESKYTTSEFIASLHSDETIINYYPTKENIYVIVLDKKGIQKISKIANKEKVYQNIIAYRKAILNKKEVSKLSSQLFEILLKNQPIYSNKLTIITKGILSFLPFESLSKDKKFLIEEYTIHYSSSLSLYALQKNLVTQKEFNLAVFNPNYKNTSFSILPFAEKEALFLKDKFNAAYFSNELATKNNFFKNKGAYNIYHLAMHAKVDNEQSDASKLIFGTENLYFSDLYAQKLPLDLIVLSACDTGFGKNLAGEGIMSLSRAFTYSGVASTIHSLWQTPDKQGAEIMQYFYQHLANGFTKDEALQKAKLDFLKSTKAEELKHPYYWSGFVLSGNPDALASKSNNWVFIVLGVVVLFIVLFYLKFSK